MSRRRQGRGAGDGQAKHERSLRCTRLAAPGAIPARSSGDARAHCSGSRASLCGRDVPVVMTLTRPIAGSSSSTFHHPELGHAHRRAQADLNRFSSPRSSRTSQKAGGRHSHHCHQSSDLLVSQDDGATANYVVKRSVTAAPARHIRGQWYLVDVTVVRPCPAGSTLPLFLSTTRGSARVARWSTGLPLPDPSARAIRLTVTARRPHRHRRRRRLIRIEITGV